MKPDKDKITAAIAAMTGICAEGRKQVTAIVEGIIGEPLTPIMDYTLRVGDVWQTESGGTKCVLLSTYNGGWILGGLRRELSAYSDGFQTDGACREAVQQHFKIGNWRNLGPIKLIWPS